jgi:hypothetical protein
MIRKLAIAAALVTVIVAGGYLWMLHGIDKALDGGMSDMGDIAVAMKGSLGEAIFDPKPAEVRIINTDKTGLDALFDGTQDDRSSPGVLDAYKRNPDKFKRYAEMVDTAMRAKQLAVLLEARTFDGPMESTAISNLPTDLTRDSWNNPYCIFQMPGGVAVVSGPVRGKAETCKFTSERVAEFARAKRPIFQSASHEVVVISRKDKKPS